MSWLGAMAAIWFGLSHTPSVIPDAAAAPRWFEQGRLTRPAQQLLAVLYIAPRYGLDARDYDLHLTAAELAALRNGTATPVRRARFDAALSAVAARFITDVRYGRIDPRMAGFDLPIAISPASVEGFVTQIARSTDVAAAVAKLEPRSRPYRLLEQAMRKYRELAARPGLNVLPIPTTRSLRRGDAYIGAPQLRALLAALDDLPAADAAAHAEELVIDARLATAVAKFQKRHGLAGDGVIGPATFSALTVPLQQRVRQLALTLERWRWLTRLDRPDILVNIPQFVLHAAHRTNAPAAALDMPVVVGRNDPQMRTPIFAAKIREVVFHPYWDVPAGILERELLPLIQRDAAYLERHHLEIVSGARDDAVVQDVTPGAIAGLASGRYRLRQRPGRDNALGAIKFVMPNAYDVYLHSTPYADTFKRARRAFSHGCIRVADPAALAAYVLSGVPGDWSVAAVQKLLSAAATARVKVPKPVSVVIFYSTAAVDDSDSILFFEDLYGHDRVLQATLATARSPL